nr:MFS transporter [Shuttleworthia satelles]
MFAKSASPKFKAKATLLLLISFLTMYVSAMMGADIINVVQNPIMKELGCSATQAVFGWTIGGYTIIFIAFLFSTIIMKKGVRGFAGLSFLILALGAFLVGLGYSMKSVAIISLGGFLLKNFVQAIQLCVFQVVAGWFCETRGLVLGLMGAAFALESSTASSGMTLLYSSIGFVSMMMILTVILLALGAVTFLFVRTRPQECGLTVDGLPEENAEGAEKAEIQTRDGVNAAEVKAQDGSNAAHQSRWTLGKLIRIKESWCIMIGIGIFNMTLTAVVTQFFNSLMGMGLKMGTCMTYMVIFGLLGIVTAPIFGKLVDSIGAHMTGVILALLFVLTVCGFAFHIPLLAAAGLAFFVGTPILQPALTMNIFGGAEYQATTRYFSIVINLIAACGIPFMTIFFDLTGSHQMAYYVLLVMNVIALLLMAICNKTYVEE